MSIREGLLDYNTSKATRAWDGTLSYGSYVLLVTLRVIQRIIYSISHALPRNSLNLGLYSPVRLYDSSVNQILTPREGNFWSKAGRFSLNFTLTCSASLSLFMQHPGSQHLVYAVCENMDFAWILDFLQGMIKPVAATAVVLMAVLLSIFQRLGLEGEMIFSIIRAFLQLSVIGFVLQFIFTQEKSFWIILAYLFMVRS